MIDALPIFDRLGNVCVPGSIVTASATALPYDDAQFACVSTSPPYNQDVEYLNGVNDRVDWASYVLMAGDAAAEIERVLIPGGRCWVNVQPTAAANPGEPGGARVDLAGIWSEALEDAGLTYRDVVVWQQDSHDGGCAWGSWALPTAPNLRGSYEVILLFSKGEWKRERPKGITVESTWREPRVDLGGDLTDLYRNVWKISPRRRAVGAPAPFPIDLPARCIRLSTWPGEAVLDPFAGSGTTLDAAAMLSHPRIGYGVDLAPSHARTPQSTL